jgi:uncharacterized protein (TIGR02246 family)
MPARFIVAFAITITAVLTAGLASAHAQETGSTGSPVAMPPVLIAWLDSFSVGNPEAFADLYTEDGVFEDVPNGVVATGHEEIAAAIAPVFASVSESNAEAVGGFQAGNQVAMEYQATAVDAASGTEFSFRGVDHRRARGRSDQADDRILRRRYDPRAAWSAPWTTGNS